MDIRLGLTNEDVVYTSKDTGRSVFDLGRRSVVGNRYVVTDEDWTILFSSPYLIDAMDFASIDLEEFL